MKSQFCVKNNNQWKHQKSVLGPTHSMMPLPWSLKMLVYYYWSWGLEGTQLNYENNIKKNKNVQDKWKAYAMLFLNSLWRQKRSLLCSTHSMMPLPWNFEMPPYRFLSSLHPHVFTNEDCKFVIMNAESNLILFRKYFYMPPYIYTFTLNQRTIDGYQRWRAQLVFNKDGNANFSYNFKELCIIFSAMS